MAIVSDAPARFRAAHGARRSARCLRPSPGRRSVRVDGELVVACRRSDQPGAPAIRRSREAPVVTSFGGRERRTGRRPQTPAFRRSADVAPDPCFARRCHITQTPVFRPEGRRRARPAFRPECRRRARRRLSPSAADAPGTRRTPGLRAKRRARRRAWTPGCAPRRRRPATLHAGVAPGGARRFRRTCPPRRGAPGSTLAPAKAPSRARDPDDLGGPGLSLRGFSCTRHRVVATHTREYMSSSPSVGGRQTADPRAVAGRRSAAARVPPGSPRRGGQRAADRRPPGATPAWSGPGRRASERSPCPPAAARSALRAQPGCPSACPARRRHLRAKRRVWRDVASGRNAGFWRTSHLRAKHRLWRDVGTSGQTPASWRDVGTSGKRRVWRARAGSPPRDRLTRLH